jgi:predicted pyridoxine 5'-phosphate oxidase superfamily flavin-nucleotide-binding protein
MAKLTTEAKRIIGELRLAMVATASKGGRPNVSLKGLQVLDDEHVGFADVASPRTMANLGENPQISAIVFDPATRKGCRLWGKAEIMEGGDLFNSMSADYAKMKMKVKRVVRVTVTEVETF